MTAGLIQQLTRAGGLIEDVTGAFTEIALKAALRESTKNGTQTDIFLSAANKDIFNGFNGASSAVTINTDKGNTEAGFYVDTYNYEGMIMNVKMDLSVPDDVVPIVNIGKCKKGWKANDALAYHDETPQSSREFRSSFNGSYGIAIEDVGYEHTILTNLTT
ncbi:MAG: hypothetical protein JRE23_16935 [Deltaproteobacteria bacterium]|nr:hypothetical protein [Deltaproteobacteria bacterium]